MTNLSLERPLEREVEGSPGSGSAPEAIGPTEQPTGEVRRLERRTRSRPEDWLVSSPANFLGKRGPAPGQPVEHHVATARRGRQRHQRIVPTRRLGESSQKRRLTEAQVGGRSAEVEPGGGFDPDGALAERHPVQVLLEQLLFREVKIEPDRPGQLAELATPVPGRSAEEAGQLHRDGRGTGHDPPTAEILPGGPGHGQGIDAVMEPEPAILRGHESHQQIGIERRERPPSLPATIVRPGGAKHRPVPSPDHHPVIVGWRQQRRVERTGRPDRAEDA